MNKKELILAAIVALLLCYGLTFTISYILYKKKKYDELLEDCDKEFPSEDIEEL